jgi:hypothetical protein
VSSITALTKATNRSPQLAQQRPKSELRDRGAADRRLLTVATTFTPPADCHSRRRRSQTCRSAPAPASSAPSAQTSASTTPAAMRRPPALSPPASPSSGTLLLDPRPSTSGASNCFPAALRTQTAGNGQCDQPATRSRTRSAPHHHHIPHVQNVH